MFRLRVSGVGLACLAGFLFPFPAQAQLRVMTYNVTNYSGGRVADFQSALFGEFQGRSARPDVFVGQEFINAAGLTAFLNLMNTAAGSPGDYQAAPFVAGPDTNSVFIYRSAKVVYEGYKVVATGGNSPKPPRNIMRYDLHLVGYSGNLAKLSVYSTHMKAGTTQDDKDRRLAETQIIRDDAATLGHPFVIGGDFNVQSSNESSYVELTGSQTDDGGRFFDPIKSPGSWNSNAGFKFIHSQDPWTGGAGMDDRYDFILTSSNLLDGGGFDYLGNPGVPYSSSTWNDPNHSYRAWGNDGTSFEQSLKVTGNTMVGPTIAQALVNSCGNQSGHIPVFMDMRVPGRLGAPVLFDMGLFRLFQNGQRSFVVSNNADTALWTANGINPLVYSMSASNGFSVNGSQYSLGADGTRLHTVTVDTSTPGIKSGTVTVASNDPDKPSYAIQVKAVVGPLPIGR